jgi:hypothetical protein
MELHATMALDRDAMNTVTLHLLPPSTAPASATCWLLLHTIPITASLSRTLSRLVSIEEAAMARAASVATPASAAELVPPPSAVPSAAAERTRPTDVVSTTSTRGSAVSRTLDHSSASSSSSTSSPASTPNTSFARLHVAGWLEFMRVGYVLSEIHSYCVLLKCRSPAQAVQLKAALEEGAALGVTAPVEFVSDTALVTVARRTFAAAPESQRELLSQGEALEAHALRPSVAAPSQSLQEKEQQEQKQRPEHDREGRVPPQAPPRWRTEVHTTTLLHAVTTIYPVRDGEGVEDEGDDGCGGGDDDDDDDDADTGGRSTSDRLRKSTRDGQPHRRHGPHSPQRSLMPSPYPQQQQRRRGCAHSGRWALSAPPSPSFCELWTPRSLPPSTTTTTTTANAAATPSTSPVPGPARTTRPAVSKGAAPPPPASSSSAAAPTLSRHTTTTITTTAASSHYQGNHYSHTPLHLPVPCAEGGCGGTPLQLDATGAVSSGLPAKAAGCLSEECCAICQVDPLRSGACVTTLCQHTFHLHCYARLPSSSAECPLCRFSVYDLLNDARCEVCGTYEDLWVCLICGHVACGRARRDHQQAHYRSSGHSCAWQSSTNRIWNLSSRMFLHQEVVMLLDDAEDLGSSSEVAYRACASGCGDGDGDTGAWMDRLRCVSWAEPLDADLQEALNESKEEAVAHYYSELLQQLAEEQRRYYEKRLAEEQRSRRKPHRWHTAALQGNRQDDTQGATGASQPMERSDGDANAIRAGRQPTASSFQTVHSLVQEERRQRRRVLAEYAPTTVAILQQAQRDYTDMYNRLKTSRDDVQQQVLLRSHFNSGLVTQMEQIEQRTREMRRNGEKNLQARKAEEALLQARVDEALSAL